MKILTNFVTVRSAGVGEELQGRVGAAATLVGDGRLNILRVITADGGKVSRVVGVAGRKLSARVRGLPSRVYGDAYPMTDRTQAGVWAAEAMLARATKARAKVDFLKNMAKSERSRCRIDRDKIAQRI